MRAIFQTLAIIATLFRLPITCMRYFSVIIVLLIISPLQSGSPTSAVRQRVDLLCGVPDICAFPECRSFIKGEILVTSLCFFAANTVWTMIYETIYAHQDVADDMHVSLKSVPVKIKVSIKKLTSLLACVMTAFLTMTAVLPT